MRSNTPTIAVSCLIGQLRFRAGVVLARSIPKYGNIATREVQDCRLQPRIFEQQVFYQMLVGAYRSIVQLTLGKERRKDAAWHHHKGNVVLESGVHNQLDGRIGVESHQDRSLFDLGQQMWQGGFGKENFMLRDPFSKCFPNKVWMLTTALLDTDLPLFWQMREHRLDKASLQVSWARINNGYIGLVAHAESGRKLPLAASSNVHYVGNFKVSHQPLGHLLHLALVEGAVALSGRLSLGFRHVWHKILHIALVEGSVGIAGRLLLALLVLVMLVFDGPAEKIKKMSSWEQWDSMGATASYPSSKTKFGGVRVG